MTTFETPTILQNKSLRLLMGARISTAIAFQMLTVAIGWQIYSITQSAFYLGLVGLVQFLPMFLLTLVVGHVADRYDRKTIICTSQIIEGIGILCLALGSYNGWITKERILIIIFFIGIANAFQGPPMQALLPNIVSKKDFPQAAAMTASAFQFAVIIGPGLGGFLYSVGPGIVYLISGILVLLTSMLISFISLKNVQAKPEPATIKSVFAGISFIKNKPIILGAISLDLFAVLFGGAVAMVPVYAKDILHVGPIGFGWLNAATDIGSITMVIALTLNPLKKKQGIKLLLAVTGFGICIIIFGLSKWYWLSFVALVVGGIFDGVSVVVRGNIMQLKTPDELRGRVMSVNSMFINSSNEIGQFESGAAAKLMGVIPSVVFGGCMTIFVVVATWIKAPSLKKLEY